MKRFPNWLILRNVYAYLFLQYRTSKYRLKWKAPPPIFDTLSVSPDQIHRTNKWNHLNNKSQIKPDVLKDRNFKLIGKIADGNWDQSNKFFKDSVVYRSLEDHFLTDTKWKDTTLWSQMEQELSKGNVHWGVSTRKELEQRFKEIDLLYDEIAKSGLKSQQDRMQTEDQSQITQIVDLVTALENEIQVNIGRAGELLFNEGRHRLAIAKLQDLDSIPVIVCVRHKKWQNIREKIATGQLSTGGLDEDLQTHPDLVDLLDDHSPT